jgi:hypothetical protein
MLKILPNLKPNDKLSQKSTGASLSKVANDFFTLIVSANVKNFVKLKT